MKKIITRFAKRAEKLQKAAVLMSWRVAPNMTSTFLVNYARALIPTITDNLEQHGDFKAALKLTSRKTFTGYHPLISVALYSRFLKKLGRLPELKSWYDENSERIVATPIGSHNKKLRSMLLRAGDELQIHGLRAALLQQALLDLNCEDRRVTDTARKFLFDNRIYFLLQDRLFEKGAHVKWRDIKQVFEVRLHSNDISHWVDAASKNELREPDQRITLHSDKSAAPRIEIFIPTHFFAQWDIKKGGARQANWHEIREMFRRLAATLEDLRIPVQPRHQYYMDCATPSETMPAISFFSHGGSPRNWHMRDVGIKGLVSIDPEGYWGHSCISDEDISERLASMVVSQSEIDQAVSSLRIWFSGSGGNKYAAGPDKQSEADIEQGSIFVPLQAPNGLEATNRRVEELISLLADFSEESQTTIYLRRHPLDYSPLVTKAIASAAKRSKCVLSVLSPWELSTRTSATVSLNSATIMQAVVAGKPVFTWGKSDVHSVATDIGDYAEFKRNMGAALSSENPKKDLQDRFSYFYLRRYLVDVSDRQSVERRMNLIAEVSEMSSQAEVRKRFLDSLFQL